MEEDNKHEIITVDAATVANIATKRIISILNATSLIDSVISRTERSA